MNKIPQATHEWVLDISGTMLSVSVLDDWRRVIKLSSVFKAFGRTKRWRAKNENRVLNRPAFIDARNLQSFILNDLEQMLIKIDYKTKNWWITDGFDANILPLLCKVYLDARESKVLLPSQLPLARASEVLLIALSKIGIIALVDEATWYQYDREKDELQKILKAYISPELLPWQKRFPDVYYKELFRLNGWDFTVNWIKKRPWVIWKWTNKLIYEQLPPGVLDALKIATPVSQSWNKTARLHQSLTIDIWNSHLEWQINQIITLFHLSDNMEHMWKQFKLLKQRQSWQMELPFSFDANGFTIDNSIES